MGCEEGDSCHTDLQHHPGQCPFGQYCILKDSCHAHSVSLSEIRGREKDRI